MYMTLVVDILLDARLQLNVIISGILRVIDKDMTRVIFYCLFCFYSGNIIR